MNTVRELFQKAYQKASSIIPNDTYAFTLKDNDGNVKSYQISPVQFRKALKNKFGNFDPFSKVFTQHLSGQKNIIAAFASTPTSFSDAWNMKAEELIAEDVLALSRAGGHFQFNQIPYGPNNSGSGLYQSNYAKGLVHSKGKGLIKGFRHKTGGIYKEDNLNEMGVFTYATPTDAAGMMEYRFIEKFSKELGIPFVYIITQWFRYKTNFEDLNSWLYMTGVAKVVSDMDHPHKPIQLQLVNKEDALKILNSLLDAMKTKGEYKVRPPLHEHLRLGWSYSKIERDKEKRSRLIDYAVKNNLRCPGDKCKHAFFKDLKPSEIHIGHRISQNWSSVNFGVADIHHPYNLYLTCRLCNISLREKYPSEIDLLINESGTIGDWLMNDLLE